MRRRNIPLPGTTAVSNDMTRYSSESSDYFVHVYYADMKYSHNSLGCEQPSGLAIKQSHVMIQKVLSKSDPHSTTPAFIMFKTQWNSLLPNMMNS